MATVVTNIAEGGAERGVGGGALRGNRDRATKSSSEGGLSAPRPRHRKNRDFEMAALATRRASSGEIRDPCGDPAARFDDAKVADRGHRPARTPTRPRWLPDAQFFACITCRHRRPLHSERATASRWIEAGSIEQFAAEEDSSDDDLPTLTTPSSSTTSSTPCASPCARSPKMLAIADPPHCIKKLCNMPEKSADGIRSRYLRAG